MYRPKTAKPKLTGTSSTSSTSSQHSSSGTSEEGDDEQSVSVDVRGGAYSRCPACSGRPIKRNQVIPEERIPFPPVKKTINRKLLNEPKILHSCCKYCC